MAEPPIVAYEGDTAGLAATAPRLGEHVNPNSANVRRYSQFLDRRHTEVLAAVEASASAEFYDYRFSFNGFAAELTPAQSARLAAQPGVVALTPEERQKLATDNTPLGPGLAGDGGLWQQYEQTGEDVIVGVIDTGIWPEHPSFSDQADFVSRPGPAGNAQRVYGPPPAHWHGTCQSGELLSQRHCNNKLIGARYFVTGALAPRSSRCSATGSGYAWWGKVSAGHVPGNTFLKAKDLPYSTYECIVYCIADGKVAESTAYVNWLDPYVQVGLVDASTLTGS